MVRVPELTDQFLRHIVDCDDILIQQAHRAGN